MGLLDDIRAEKATGPDRCTVAVLLDVLGDDDRTDLIAALDDAAIPHTAIARALTKNGHDMHEKRVASHRRGDCACAR